MIFLAPSLISFIRQIYSKGFKNDEENTKIAQIFHFTTYPSPCALNEDSAHCKKRSSAHIQPSTAVIVQPRPQGLLLDQNGGRRNPWPRLLKYSTNRGVFCHVTHDEMAFSEVVSSVWRPCLFSAIGNLYSNKTKTFHRVCVAKF